MEDEPCGATFEIDSVDLMQWGNDNPIRKIEGVTLVCSRPLNHTPRNRHSDGVTDWMGDEDE